MERFSSQPARVPTFDRPTASTYTLARIAEERETGAILVVHDSRVYDATPWVLEHEVQGEEVRNLADEDAEGAGELWAGFVGEGKDEYKVGTFVTERTLAEQDSIGPESSSPPGSYEPSRSGTPATPTAAGANTASYDQAEPTANVAPGRGLSHLDYAFRLLSERQTMLQAAQRNEQFARDEVRRAAKLVREAEQLRDGLVLMAMEGERPKWNAPWP